MGRLDPDQGQVWRRPPRLRRCRRSSSACHASLGRPIRSPGMKCSSHPCRGRGDPLPEIARGNAAQGGSRQQRIAACRSAAPGSRQDRREQRDPVPTARRISGTAFAQIDSLAHRDRPGAGGSRWSAPAVAVLRDPDPAFT